MPKEKYYVVWKGRKTGIFTSWAECEKQVKGFVGAEFKAFGLLKEAESAFESRYEAYKGKSSSLGSGRKPASSQSFHPFVWMRPAVARLGRWNIEAFSLESGGEFFHVGPFPDGTNNVGEFLAVVHALDVAG